MTNCELNKNSNRMPAGMDAVMSGPLHDLVKIFFYFYFDVQRPSSFILAPPFIRLTEGTNVRLQFYYISSDHTRPDFHMHLFYWSVKIAESTVYSKHTSEMCSTRAQMCTTRKNKKISAENPKLNHGTGIQQTRFSFCVFLLFRMPAFIFPFFFVRRNLCVCVPGDFFFLRAVLSHSFCTIIVFRSKTNVSEEIRFVRIYVNRAISCVGCDGFCGIYPSLLPLLPNAIRSAKTERCACVRELFGFADGFLLSCVSTNSI